ncbi:hypothetical protein G6O69_24740 [Pseudenhygromyxa sp. WMMC2535]|uniref:hypothetical protein n=1 Tax=Pseudenhygromyxa sp. WMMC2535 TaxID=2712867 RepID=UPI001555F9D2|nr:hypothetical protein [Pseudenhygromyxa sp. WMMC2535]NVB41070.1 hypothetical protein [Pseudenhygromyxa sp. WMMC2535]
MDADERQHRGHLLEHGPTPKTSTRTKAGAAPRSETKEVPTFCAAPGTSCVVDYEATDSSGRRVLVANSGKTVAGLPATTDVKGSMAQGQTFTTPGGRKYTVQPNANDTNAPGNCAAPKLIHSAVQQGLAPVGMTEFWVGPANSNFNDGDHAPSCPTCQRILSSMLCPEPPDPENPDQVYTVQ